MKYSLNFVCWRFLSNTVSIDKIPHKYYGFYPRQILYPCFNESGFHPPPLLVLHFCKNSHYTMFKHWKLRRKLFVGFAAPHAHIKFAFQVSDMRIHISCCYFFFINVGLQEYCTYRSVWEWRTCLIYSYSYRSLFEGGVIVVRHVKDFFSLQNAVKQIHAFQINFLFCYMTYLNDLSTVRCVNEIFAI